ncbi:hypothetical protein N9C56_15400, partial [Paracoccaceae bacterium]|nr:hypothetical protein [Paracoccaceae bacterium]
QIQPNGALSLQRSVQFWSGVDRSVSLCLSGMSITQRHTMYARIRNVYGMCTFNLITMLELQKED